MSDLAIRVENLGKLYRIGTQRARYKTLRESLTSALADPFRRWRDGRRETEDRSTSSQSPVPGPGSTSPRPRSPVPGLDDTIWALKDVSFEVKQGEVVGIIGRNGAGKSTLLKILSRITAPTEGRVEVFGRVGSLLEVGTGFHPELTGRENIYLNGAILGMHKLEIEYKFDEIVAFAEVEKFIDTPVKHYSSGMYVRLAFAVAAHLEPEILLVDEVLAVGDAAFQRKCLGKMGEVAKGGRTVLFVSHNLGAVRSLCSRVLWLDEGGLSMTGLPPAIIDSYLKLMLAPSSPVLALDSSPRRPGFGDRFRLRNVEFNGGGPLLHGEPLSVRIHYVVRGEVHGVSLGFGFSTLDGVRLISIDSDLLGIRRDLSKDAHGFAEAKVESLLLQPGHYTLDVGARSGDNNALDYLPGCAQVEVLPGPNTPGLIIRDGGGVRMPSVWRWHDASNEELTTSVS